MRWLFGDFALDQERRQLFRAGAPLPLTPKAYELLSLLVARRPRALSKPQIRDVLSPRSVEPRALGLEGRVAAATTGEMAVILPSGTLARRPLEGGAPREIVEDARGADWGPDGSLAVLRERRVEFPVGHVLSETGPSAMLDRDLRVSPRGDRVAFVEHPLDAMYPGGRVAPDPGHVVVLDRRGRKVVSSHWASLGGLAWKPDGEEVWFTAAKTGSGSAVQAMSLDGRERLVAEMGETIHLHDISREGRVLVAQGRVSSEARGKLALDRAERDYSWLDGTIRPRLSPDGRLFVFSEAGDGGRPVARAYLRRGDGSPAVWLGEGAALDISPDGKWVACVSPGPPAELRLVPTGAGEARPLRRGMIDGFLLDALFLPDGSALVIRASGTGGTRLFLDALPDGDPQPFTRERILDVAAISPDGRFVVARGPEAWALYPVDGSPPHPIRGLGKGDVPQRFNTDGSALFVLDTQSGRPPGREVVRLDLRSGRKSTWVVPGFGDTAFIGLTGFDITPDGRSYLYSHQRVFSDLYVIDGLR
jgi:hypothetical protein